MLPAVEELPLTRFSFGVWAADTWLHVTTSAATLSRGVTNTSQYSSYSRILNCFDHDDNTCSTGSDGLIEVTEAFLTLNNLSSQHAVSTVQIDGESYAYLTDSNLARGVDYSASTYAVTTQCFPSPASCGLSCG